VRRERLCWFTVTIFTVILSACGYWEHATVTVVYETKMQPETWRLPKAQRKSVEDAFKLFSEQNGYQCRANIKHAEELTCRGPKDLYLAFQPALNKPEFVATFSWVDSSNRSHQEFIKLVSEFRAQMSAVVGEKNVQIGGKT